MNKIFIVCAVFILLNTVTSQAQKLIKNFSSVSNITPYNGFLLFTADDGLHGPELWRSDGTTAGTTLVKDISPGSVGSSPSYLTVYKGKVYFAANDGVNGDELWVSDGTVAGTIMFADINTYKGIYNNGSNPISLTVANNKLFFVATNSSSVPTSTLFVTDGTTAAGIIQLIPTLNDLPGQLTAVQNTLYYTIGSYSSELWKTDGTVAGTQAVNMPAYVTLSQLSNINNKLVFTATNSSPQNVSIYQADPASANAPVLLHSYTPVQYGGVVLSNIKQAGNGFFYSQESTDANNNGTDSLWYSDGTLKGTTSIKGFPWMPYLAYSNMQDFVNYNNKLYFAAPGSFALWTSDGTSAGTTQVPGVTLPSGMTPVLSNNKLFYVEGGSLYAMNASNKPVLQFSTPQSPTSLQDVNGTLYFSAKSGTSNGLWNNISSPQLNVEIGYQNINSSSTYNMQTRVDSAVTALVTISNGGNGPLTLSEISISGTAFYVNGKPSQVLKPGAQANFNLVYFPARQDQQSGSLLIRSNDNTQNNFVIDLTGTIHIGNATNSAVPTGLDKSIDFSDTSTAIKLSNNTVNGNLPIGTTIGTFSIKGNQAGTVYQLTSGDGDTDNTSFIVDSGKLKTAKVFNFATNNTYSVRIAAILAGITYQQAFVIEVKKPADTTTITGNCGNGLQSLAYGLYDIGVNGNRIVAVGSNGRIIESIDKGANWTAVNTGVVKDLRKIHFTDNNTGYILGAGGTVLKSTDGGASWSVLNVPQVPYPYLTTMAFPNANTGYLFGSGVAYKTNDGGKSWVQLTFNNYNNISSAFFTDEKIGYVCGTSNTLMRTTDGGLTWTALNSTLGESTSLTSIFFVNSTGYLFTTGSDVMKTSDGGTTWKRATSLPNTYVQSSYFLTQQTGYTVAGYNGSAIYQTTDGGITWTDAADGGRGDFTGISFSKDGALGCAVGIGAGSGSSAGPGRALFIKQASQNWQNVFDLTGDDFNSVKFTDANTGYLFGNAANLKTTDAGITWHQMNLDLSQQYPYPFITSFFSSKNIGYCSVMAELFKTTDAGVTWEKIFNGDGTEQIRSIYFITDSIGFLSTGENGVIQKTTDGGATWKASADLLPTGNFSQITFVNATTGFAAGSMGVVKTTDQGLTWKTMNTGANSAAFFTTIHMFDANNGIVGGLSGLVMKTNDGGNTWNQLATAITADIEYFCFLDSLHGYAFSGNYGTSYQYIFETFDGGNTWQSAGQSSTGQSISLQGNTIYLSGQGGVIEKLGPNSPPAAAGYITGDTEVSAKTKTDYIATAGQNVNYKWSVSGGLPIDYSGNRATVQWTTPGKYVLQATTYNNCGLGAVTSLNITVDSTLKQPVITGPDTVLSGARSVSYQTLADTSLVYTWYATGDSTLTSSANTALVNWGQPGNAQVNVIETQPSTGIRALASLNVLINQAPFTQPANNFKVQIIAEPCKGDNDGVIMITAAQKINYTVVFQGSNNKTYHFTDTLHITGLSAGTYKLAITADGKTGYERDFTVMVTEPKDLSVYALVNQLDNTINLNLSGGAVYTINLNGAVTTTSAANISLNLVQGENNLVISTDKACQGIIQKHLKVASDIVIYPNPFTDVINLQINTKNSGTAKITLRNLDGKILWSGTKQINNKQIQIVPVELNSGIYILQLTLDNNFYEYKICKK